MIIEVFLFLSDCGVETTTKFKLSSGVVALELVTVTTSLTFSRGCTFSCESLLLSCFSSACLISETFTGEKHTSSGTSRFLSTFSSTLDGSGFGSSNIGSGGGGGGSGISATRRGLELGGVSGGVIGDEGGVSSGGTRIGGGGAGPLSLSEDDDEVDCWVCKGGGGGAFPLSRDVFLCTSSFFSG